MTEQPEPAHLSPQELSSRISHVGLTFEDLRAILCMPEGMILVGVSEYGMGGLVNFRVLSPEVPSLLDVGGENPAIQPFASKVHDDQGRTWWSLDYRRPWEDQPGPTFHGLHEEQA